mmetsp:Transcript_8674/g.11738  ORF Transcript_8674/g.11738 Transcript_8674/m.11738 type:complete len:230 (-) Transcript_8674:314-1003(-)
MVLLLFDQIGHSHVRVSNSFYLEDLVFPGEQVKLLVKTVQHVHHLDGLQRAGDVCEADNVREEHSHAVVVLRVHLFAVLQRVRNSFGKHLVQQALGRHDLRGPPPESVVCSHAFFYTLSNLHEGWAPERILVPALLHQIHQVLLHFGGGRELGSEVICPGEICNLGQHFLLLPFALVRLLAGEQLEQSDAEGVNVRGRAGFRSMEELRSHPVGRPHHTVHHRLLTESEV